MKKKILILENFVHYRNAVESIKLYSQGFDVKLIIPKIDHNKVEKKFFKDCFFFSGPKFLVYLYTLIKSFKYDYVIISTLPEYPQNLKTLKNIFFFIFYYSFYLLMSICIKKKLILQIRNIEAYDLKKKTILNNVRNYFLKFSNKFICETQFISKKFKFEILTAKKKMVTYQYINHTDEKHHFVK